MDKLVIVHPRSITQKFFVVIVFSLLILPSDLLANQDLVSIVQDYNLSLDEKIAELNQAIKSGVNSADLKMALIESINANLDDLAITKYLVSKGANISVLYGQNIGNTIAEEALEEYIRKDFSPGVRFLLSQNIKFKPDYLYKAIKRNSTQSALLLIANGVNVGFMNGEIEDSKPLLHLAAENGNTSIINALLRAGADVNIKNRKNRTAVMVAEKVASRQVHSQDITPTDLFSSAAMQDELSKSRNYLSTIQTLLANGAVPPYGEATYLRTYKVIVDDMYLTLKQRDFRKFLNQYLWKEELAELFRLSKTDSVDSFEKSEFFKLHMKLYLAMLQNKLKMISQYYDLWSIGLSAGQVPMARLIVADTAVPIFDYKGQKIREVEFVFPSEKKRVASIFVGEDDSGKYTQSWIDPEGIATLEITTKPMENFSKKTQFFMLMRFSRELYNAGYYNESIDAVQKIISFIEQDKRNQNILPTMLYNLAMFQFSSGKLKEAEESAIKSIKLSPGLKKNLSQWMATDLLVTIYGYSAQLEKAAQYAKLLEKELVEFLKLLRKNDNRAQRAHFYTRVVWGYQNLATYYQLVGEYNKARDVLVNARDAAIASEGADEITINQLNLSLASLYTLTGQYESAKSLYADIITALKSIASEQTEQMVQAQNGLALIYLLEGDPQKAARYTKSATELSKIVWGKKHNNYGLQLLKLGMSYMSQGNYIFAIEQYKIADKILKSTNQSNRWSALIQLAQAYLAQNNFNESEKYINDAEREVIKHFGKEHKNYTVVLASKAQLFNKQNRIPDSKRLWLKVLERVERERGQFNNDYDRQEYLRTITSYYNTLIKIALATNDISLAINTIERLKGKTFLELLVNKKLQLADKSAQELLREIDKLDRMHNILNNESLMENNPTLSDIRGLRRVKEITSVNKDRHRLLQKMRHLNLEFSQLASVNAIGLKEIQNMLSDGETVLMYHELAVDLSEVDNKTELVVFAINKNNVGWKRIPNAKKVYKQVEKLLNQIQTPKSDDRMLKESAAVLYDALVKAVEKEIANSKQLIIIPFGKLNFLPFATLYDRNGYLIKKYKINNVPSASINKFLRARKSTNIDNLTAFADPISNLGSLIGARNEVKAIGHLFSRPAIYIGQAASETKIKTMQSSPAILHIASHGVFDPIAPERSYLSLSKDAANDGNLEVHEAYGLNLNSTRLVVLSACETAAGKLSGGDEVISLIRPFLYSGAQNVVASLWQVSDEATSQLMKQFYTDLIKNRLSIAHALQDAQLSMLNSNEFNHPYYWAAFQVYGSDRKTGGAVTTPHI